MIYGEWFTNRGIRVGKLFGAVVVRLQSEGLSPVERQHLRERCRVVLWEYLTITGTQNKKFDGLFTEKNPATQRVENTAMFVTSTPPLQQRSTSERLGRGRYL